MKYYILDLRTLKPVSVNRNTWRKRSQNDKDINTIDRTLLPNGYLVSTKFMHIFCRPNHGQNFETMVLKDSKKQNWKNIESKMYRTYKNAQAGHKKLVRKWRKVKNLDIGK